MYPLSLLSVVLFLTILSELKPEIDSKGQNNKRQMKRTSVLFTNAQAKITLRNEDGFQCIVVVE